MESMIEQPHANEFSAKLKKSFKETNKMIPEICENPPWSGTPTTLQTQRDMNEQFKRENNVH